MAVSPCRMCCPAPRPVSAGVQPNFRICSTPLRFRLELRPSTARSRLPGQCGRVFADDFLCEGVVDRLLERRGPFDEAGGYQPVAEAVIAGARQDRVAAPDA